MSERVRVIEVEREGEMRGFEVMSGAVVVVGGSGVEVYQKG